MGCKRSPGIALFLFERQPNLVSNEIRITKAIYQEKDCSQDVCKANSKDLLRLKGTQGMGLADQPQKGRLQ